MTDAYKRLTAHFDKIGNLRHVAAIAGWDEASMMPVGGGDARGRAMATLDVVIHDLLINPDVGDWLAAAGNMNLDQWRAANVREMERQYREATCLEPELVHHQSIARSTCEQAWRTLRAENDWLNFCPLLEEVVRLAREEAAARSATSRLSLYDSMLDTFEPGMRTDKLDSLFQPLRDFLPAFLDEVTERQQSEGQHSLGSKFPLAQQRRLGELLMQMLGFDFNHGRLDVSHHPFCGGVAEDVRITTRYSEQDFSQSMMAVIHETGHALYEQGRPREFSTQPVSEARSAGVHESQSLIMEMQACRSAEFISHLAPVLRDTFGVEDTHPAYSTLNLHRLLTKVKPGFIRVDADEVSYPLHVIARYEIERDLIEGVVEVRDIPELWREKMLEYLHLDTEGNYKDGCMQDVHWSASLFGYFPTYTLGALMAAQLFQEAKRQLPDLMVSLGQGDFSPIVTWLRQNIHGHGSLLTTEELLIEATGTALMADPFIRHLRNRYG